MSRHEVFGSPQHTEVNNREVRVPLNTAKFRAYRDMNRVMAAMGMAMSVGFWGFPATLLYIWIMDPTERNSVLIVPAAVLSLILPLFVGAATYPVMQTAKILTKTFSQKLPALVINKQGIHDNSSDYVFGFIPWDEIKTVAVDSRYISRTNETFTGIAIVLKNKQLLLSKKPSSLRVWLDMENEISTKCRVFIPQGRIEMPVEEVVKLANEIKERK